MVQGVSVFLGEMPSRQGWNLAGGRSWFGVLLRRAREGSCDGRIDSTPDLIGDAECENRYGDGRDENEDGGVFDDPGALVVPLGRWHQPGAEHHPDPVEAVHGSDSLEGAKGAALLRLCAGEPGAGVHRGWVCGSACPWETTIRHGLGCRPASWPDVAIFLQDSLWGTGPHTVHRARCRPRWMPVTGELVVHVRAAREVTTSARRVTMMARGRWPCHGRTCNARPPCARRNPVVLDW